MNKYFQLLVCSSLVFVGAGCSSSKITGPSQPAGKASVSLPTKGGFNAIPGQKFGDMVFVKVENNYATFTGTAQLTGKHGVSELTGNECFYPDQKSVSKIPNLRKSVPVNSYFCFSNGDVAKKLLGLEGGSATVVISGYGDMTIDTSQEPSSTLVRVISKN